MMNITILVINRISLSLVVIFGFMIGLILLIDAGSFITGQQSGLRADIPVWYVVPLFLISLITTSFTKNRIINKIKLDKKSHYLYEYFIIEHGGFLDKLKLNIPVFIMTLMALYFLSFLIF